MNNIIKRVWNQNRLVNIEDLTGMVFQAEDGGHTFEISGVDDTGAAVDLSGTVAGVFRRPDNADIALTGAASNGVVSVTLSADCYVIPGRFSLTIFVTSNSQKVAIYSCVGTVAVSSGGGVAGDTPQDVVDLINAIQAAVDTIPADYTDLMESIAPEYSASSLYAKGAYAWYSGILYQSIVAITSAETFTPEHWQTIPISEGMASIDYVEEITGISLANESILALDDLEQGGFLSNGLNDSDTSLDHAKRVRSAGYFELIPNKEYEINLSGNTALICAISFYDTNDFATARKSSSGWLTGTTFTCPGNCSYGRLLIKNSANTAIAPSDITYINVHEVLPTYVNIDDRLKALEESVFPNQNYILGSDLMKRSIKAEYIGLLTYLQSFCIYDGKYYSTNGTNISVQNSSFTEISSAALNLGHGNSLQIGNSKYAYASGWDDNKVYKVDLETLSIVGTITLPTTGYTTAAIDELNSIAYIFHRVTPPATEERYNLIAYDFANNQTLFTKQTVAFAAMQAVDFYNDRIIVLNGLGTSVAPNGYRVYDTQGNIVAEYFLGQFDSNEPEGVCLDRATHELFISFVDKKLYKVTV